MWIAVAGERLPVSALNVSVGGAAVTTDAMAEVGAIVELEARFAGAAGFALEAEVVRVEPGVLGLRFLSLDQRALEALLESGAPVSSDDDDASGIRHLEPEAAPGSQSGV